MVIVLVQSDPYPPVGFCALPDKKPAHEQRPTLSDRLSRPQCLTHRPSPTPLPTFTHMLDFFAGSGTTGTVAAQLERKFIM